MDVGINENYFQDFLEREDGISDQAIYNCCYLKAKKIDKLQQNTKMEGMLHDNLKGFGSQPKKIIIKLLMMDF